MIQVNATLGYFSMKATGSCHTRSATINAVSLSKSGFVDLNLTQLRLFSFTDTRIAMRLESASSPISANMARGLLRTITSW